MVIYIIPISHIGSCNFLFGNNSIALNDIVLTSVVKNNSLHVKFKVYAMNNNLTIKFNDLSCLS